MLHALRSAQLLTLVLSSSALLACQRKQSAPQFDDPLAKQAIASEEVRFAARPAPSAMQAEASARAEGTAVGPPAVEFDTAPPPWEQRIGAIALTHPRNAAAQAQRLLELLPHLPEEALATTAETAVERLPDADYAAVALPVVTDPNTHPQALSILFADLMERPDSIALPALVRIARSDAHPFSAAALDNLRLLVGEDFGQNWDKWLESIPAATVPRP